MPLGLRARQDSCHCLRVWERLSGANLAKRSIFAAKATTACTRRGRARILTPPMSALHNNSPEVTVSVVIPALNEAGVIERVLGALGSQTRAPEEIIVVDGGSSDGTAGRAASLADIVLTGEAGRARQMNAGADAADGDVLWFLHADTVPAPDAMAALHGAVANGAQWGRFRPRLDGAHPAFRVIERFIHWRAALSGIVTGDQGLFVRRDLFHELGGFADIPLMEDVEISRRLKRRARPVCCAAELVTSSRRWERDGILRTIWLMWRLRWAYWRGVDPAVLARRYRVRGKGA